VVQPFMKVNINIVDVSVERLWPLNKSFPPKFQVNSNLNIMNFKAISENTFTSDFIFSVNYVPPIAQLRIRGIFTLIDPPTEIKATLKEKGSPKKLPPPIIQIILNSILADAVILSKIVNIPPPLPFPSIIPQKEGKRRPPSYVA